MSSKSRSSSKDKEKSSKDKKKHKESKSSSKKEKEKDKEKKKKRIKTPEPEPEPETYEDDFEDYEDDFEEEEDDEETKKEIIETEPVKLEQKEEKIETQKENEPEFESEIALRLSKNQLAPPPPLQPVKRPQKEVPKTVAIPAFTLIDNKPYTHYNEEERKSNEQRGYERLQKLRGLISIEVSKAVMFSDLAANIFEPFQVLPPNLAHAFSQTGNDGKSEEIQTDIHEMETKETQFPHIESSFNTSDKEITPADRARFKKFFLAATQTIKEILINDDTSGGNEEEETREKTVMKFSRGYNSFALGAVAQYSKASCISKGEADSVFIAFEIFESPAQDLTNKSLIVEFYLHKRRPPKRLFLVESVVSAMKLSTATSNLYVCLTDGTLCAFDLSASDASFDDFLPWVDSETDIALRRPFFDSSFLATTISDASPLVGLEVSKSQSGEEITTIDASGTITYWQSNTSSKNETNIQLTAVIRPHPILKRHSPSFAISAFCSTSKQPIRFLMGTDTGILYSVYKSDTKQAVPKIYNTEKEKYGEVTSIDANSFDQSILIVGFSSGNLAIYRSTQTSPVIHLPKVEASSRITCVLWSLSNPSAFYSIHGGNTIIYWDLSHSTSPRTVDHRQENGLIVNAKVWGNEGLSFCYMGIALDSGEAEVHMLESQPRKNNNESMMEVLNRIRI